MKYNIESINKRKKANKKLKNVFYVALILLLYNILLLVIPYISKLDVKVFGYRAYVIVTNSMSPNINQGDTIIVRQCKIEDLEQGDIITYEKKRRSYHP